MENSTLVPIGQAIEELKPRGFENLDVAVGMTYRKADTVIIIPTRQPYLHLRFHQALSGLIAPPNQQRACLFACGEEVGHAYNNMIMGVLNSPMKDWQYVLTIEDDNPPPPDAHIKLIEAIESNGGFDAVGGLYWTKGEIQMPMCYGDPDEYRQTGVINFRPRDVRNAVKNGYLVPCTGLAMGCTLWRMDLFKQLPPPWFVTVAEYVPSKGSSGFSQDLFFCKQATANGKRFACDCRIKVPHMDWRTGIAY